MRLTTGLATAVVLAGGAWAQETPQVTITGEGRVEAAPDMATFTVGVTSQADTAKAAMDRTSAGVEALLATLAQAGVEPRDIQTTGLSLNPNWNHRSDGSGPPRIEGFTAANNVTVRVRALDSLGGVLDEVLESGANTFNGLSFGLQDPAPVEDEARRAAVEDARRKAGLYASAAGVTLGRVISITEAQAQGGPQPMYRMEAAMASDSMPVAAGELSVTAEVTITWEIAE